MVKIFQAKRPTSDYPDHAMLKSLVGLNVGTYQKNPEWYARSKKHANKLSAPQWTFGMRNGGSDPARHLEKGKRRKTGTHKRICIYFEILAFLK